jgi:uncharacterized OB-fold protein
MAPTPTDPARAPDDRLIDPALFTTVDGELRLAGSRCSSCGAVAFPAQTSCARCAGSDCVHHPLARAGTVWASTVQRFTPKPPYLDSEGRHGAYAVGYVDLAGEVLVEARLLGPFDAVGIGARVELTLDDLPGRDGEPVWTFAFGPAGRTGAE